jgi:hypothetical protein
VNGSRPFVGERVVDGGGLTKVTPSTVGDTEGLAVAVAVTEGLVVVGEPVGEGLAGHALPPGLFAAKSLTAGVGDGLTRGLSGIGGSPAGKPGLAVTVITIVSDTCVPCACAFAPKDTVAAPAATALSTNVTTEARTLAVCCMARRGGMISVRC